MLKLNTKVLKKLGYENSRMNNCFTKIFSRFGICINIDYCFTSEHKYSFCENPSVYLVHCGINSLEDIELLKKAYLRGVEDIAEATIKEH